MTIFFATPEQVEGWLRQAAVRHGLAVQDDSTPHTRRRLLRPATMRDATTPGVVLDLPRLTDEGWIAGWLAAKPSLHDAVTADLLRVQVRRLRTSLRTLTTVPLYTATADGPHRSRAPSAWATEDVIASGRPLLQFPGGAVRFLVADPATDPDS